MGVSHENLENAKDTLTKISIKATHFLRATGSIVPKGFSSQFKSPCWYANLTTKEGLWDTFHLQMREDSGLISNEGFAPTLLDRTSIDESSLLCMPYFFLAGFTKCGTTTLHSVLINHKDVEEAAFKEQQWWTRSPLAREGMRPEFYQHAVMMYLLHFFHASQEISRHRNHIVFDASPSTLWDSNFFEGGQDYCAMPAVLSRVLPNAKFIVMMRDPVIRLYSHFFQRCTSRIGPGHNITNWPEEIKQDPAGYFHKQIVSDIAYFNGCLKRLSLFECSNEIMTRGKECGGVGYRLVIGIYYVHLLKWLQFFPREQFLFLKLEHMMDNPHAFLTRVTSFLGLEAVSEEQAKEWTSVQANARSIVGTDDETDRKLDLREESKRILEEFYTPYNEMLDELL